MGATTPDQIGKYRILGVLGKGAMGLVYRAEDPLLGRQCAIKVIDSADVTDEMKQRFIHEARAVAKLDHPNIVVVYDLGEHEGQPYIAMELLVGEDLKSVLRRKPRLPVREAVDIIVQVCDGLAYAHERRIIHRDIKPANIHLCPDGRVKIVDFGVAKMESTSLTQTGMVIGTPDYMSPEQIQGKAVDPRSDIFSTGVVLYEMLTHSKPFSADSITSVIYNVVFKEPPSFSQLELDVPEPVETVIARAMAKELADRYERIDLMARDLRAWLGGRPVEAPSVPVGADDATAALTAEEIEEATHAGLAAGSRTSTRQVGESRTQRRRAAEGDETVAGAPAGAAQDLDRTTALATASSSKRGLWIAAAAVVLVAAVAVWFGLRGGGGGAVVNAQPVAIEVVVSPWARIDRLERLGDDGSTEISLTERNTPLRLSLPPGSYRMQLSNPELGLQDSLPFRVDAGPGQSLRHVLRGFDPGAALGSVLAPPS